MQKSDELKVNLQKAIKRLEEIKKIPHTLVNQDASIQRFEFTFELAWKYLQEMVRMAGIDVYGPKNVLREAGKLGYITKVDLWIEYLMLRNLTTHTYDELVGEQVYEKLDGFIELVNELYKSGS